MADTGVHGAVQEAERRDNIIPEILARVLDRFSNVGVGGKVHHRVHAREHWPELRFISR